MEASEFDKLREWLFLSPSRLRNFANWAALIGTVALVIVYGGYTINDSIDDHFKYGADNQCNYHEKGGYYFHDEGYTPPNNFGHCHMGVLLRDFTLSREIKILKVGLPIAFAPFLLVLLNRGVLRFRVTAKRGITSLKTSAVKKAIDSTTRAKLAEAKSDKMERDLAKANKELDKLLAD